MHILVAADEHLDPGMAAAMVARLFEEGDQVTVLTALDHPQKLQEPHDETGAREAALISHEAGAGVIGMGSGADAAEQLAPRMSGERDRADPPHIDEYYTTTASRRLNNILARLREHGIEAEAMWTPNEQQTSSSILRAAERENADLLLIGSHGKQRFEGVIGSTATRLIRKAEIPVVVLK